VAGHFIRYDLGNRRASWPNVSDIKPTRLERSKSELAQLGQIDDNSARPVDEIEFGEAGFQPVEKAGDGKYGIEQSNPDAYDGHYFYTNNGLVLVEMGDGARYRGSGCLIGPRILLTAGHVVHEGGQAISTSFVRNFPFETTAVAASRIYVMPRWAQLQDFEHDLAIVYLDKAHNADGFHGITINAPFEEARNHYGWSTVSYPATLPGKDPCLDMVRDGGPKSHAAFQHGNMYYRAGVVAWDHWDLSPGASGGPWISNNSHPSVRLGQVLLPGQQGPRLFVPMINGVNSYSLSDKSGMIYGPDFRDAHGSFINAVLADIALNP